MGPTNCERSNHVDVHLLQRSNTDSEELYLKEQVSRYFKTDGLGVVSDTRKVMSIEDRKALKMMEESATIVDNNYEVGMLWSQNNPQLPNNRYVALKRLQHLKNRLKKDEVVHQKYREKIEEYVKKGYARKLRPDGASNTELVEWRRWKSALPALSNMKIPRCYKSNILTKTSVPTKDLKDVQLHNFSDARKLASDDPELIESTQGNLLFDVETSSFVQMLKRYSTWNILKVKIVWLTRFKSHLRNCHSKNCSCSHGKPTLAELKDAEHDIIKIIQRKEYLAEFETLRSGKDKVKESSSITKLNPFIGKDDLLRGSLVTNHVLQTVFAEVESILNSLPLTKSSEDASDATAISPAHLLLQKPAVVLPPGEFDQESVITRKKWRQAQILAKHFWNRWIREYLTTLHLRQKWLSVQRNVRVGDLVLVGNKKIRRGQWPMAIITKVFSSKDNRIRTVELKTKYSVLVRPIVDVCLLEECNT
ncbi:Hypothetical predicted protein [Paramuricea clavata]|uniref:Uncharacterized protein n=1 Tax=Paramuricea clavata TaxID=317549 RepID=A0A7D9JM28_PARCT|nr:Hypothetical predicted protein [Paramuricea clavata]